MRSELEDRFGKFFYGILVILVCLFSLLFAFLPANGQGSRRVFLPLVRNGSESTYEKKFIGIYMEQYWDEKNVSTYMPLADQLAGKKHSVSGWFIDIEDNAFIKPIDRLEVNNFYRQLEALWQAGYISFVNLNSTRTSYEIASGKVDAALRQMADVYTRWVGKGGGRRAFIAPLQEMNGYWTSYGQDPGNFKLAYQRIQNIFSQRGITRNQVWWVFAPNGWSRDGHEFERYYPGNDVTDVVAFSSYNYGYCPVAIPWQRWENYDTLYAPYISRIQVMAPNKPIIIAQTGTTAQYPKTGQYNNDMKNKWLVDNYNYLASQPAVLGVLYYDFSLDWECDWTITQGGPFTGYATGAANPAFQYLNAQDMAGMGF